MELPENFERLVLSANFSRVLTGDMVDALANTL